MSKDICSDVALSKMNCISEYIKARSETKEWVDDLKRMRPERRSIVKERKLKEDEMNMAFLESNNLLSK